MLIKEQPGDMVYELYASGATNGPVARSDLGGADRRRARPRGGNTWSHVASTFDGATLRVYVNGAQVGRAAVAGSIAGLDGRSASAATQSGRVVHGAHRRGAHLPAALAATEIQADMNKAVANPDSQPPTAPSGLTATGEWEHGRPLGWTASTDNVGVARYNVQRSTAPGFTPSTGNRVAQPTGTSYTDSGLAAGTYYYRVLAEDAAGNLAAPRARRARGDRRHDAALGTWGCDGAGARRQVESGLGGSDGQRGGVALQRPPLHDVGLHAEHGEPDRAADGHELYATRGWPRGPTTTGHGRGRGGQHRAGLERGERDGNRGHAAPTAPAGLTAPVSGNTANLTWTASTDNVGVLRYDVHRRTTAGFTPSTANRIAQPTGTSYADSGLAAGSYFYKVVAEDAAGNLSGASNEATA